MSTRPTVPQELRRRILVEAGHRCAIHTCRHPTADVHHIIPWERCREHSYENLIALCPNCHRRADAGEIDRKSLRLYKAKLSAATGTAEWGPLTGVSTVSSNSGRLWRTRRIAEESGPSSIDSFELEIPKFSSADLEALNAVEHGWACEQLLMFRRESVLYRSPSKDAAGATGSYLSGSFQVTHLSEKLVSVRYAVSQYVRDAAHPNVWFRTANGRRGPLVLLTFADLFRRNSRYAERASEIAAPVLLREGSGEDWVGSSAGPNEEHFQLFNLASEGVVITFERYHAIGPEFVTLPWSDVEDIVDWDIVVL